jgi:hypothetical protein
MRHLACRGHIRQEDETGSLVPLAGDDLIPFVEAGLQPIAHRLDGAWFVTARTARAILRAFCHLDLYLVIRAGKCPQLLGCDLGIRTTEIRLLRRFAHGHLQRHSGLLQLAL